MALRATAVYFAVFLLLRLVPKRTAGKFSLADMLTLIVIGSMTKTGIVGDSTSVGDIVLMIAIASSGVSSSIRSSITFRSSGLSCATGRLL